MAGGIIDARHDIPQDRIFALSIDCPDVAG
jgi:hypothetical protein